MNVMCINFCHRDFPINYGQTLLGYALSQAIKRLGHNPVMVSYTERDIIRRRQYYARFLTPNNTTVFQQAFARTTDFVKCNMNFVPCFTPEEVLEVSRLCDIWCVGGDVVWRKNYLKDSVFSLDFGTPAARRISYSASVYGVDEQDKDFFGDKFQKIKNTFSYISIREAKGAETIAALTGADVSCGIDPVFLLTPEEWKSAAKPVKGVDAGYVLVFIYGNASSYSEIIKDFAGKYTDREVIVIPTSREWGSEASISEGIGVEEFIWLFQNASLILTNSFHGAAFAILFSKEFYLCEREKLQGEGADFRLSELLGYLGIDDRDSQSEHRLLDYQEIGNRLKAWAEDSEDYLKKALDTNSKMTPDYPKVYAAKNRNEEIRRRSTSGGVFYELAAWTVRAGGIVYGAAFDEQFSVKHIGVESLDDIAVLMRSKYVQSRLGHTFAEIERHLEAKRKVLFVGTPCQVRSLRKYLNGKEKWLVCVSLICHGICSERTWTDYLERKCEEEGLQNIQDICFRCYEDGEPNPSIKIIGENRTYAVHQLDDPYMRGFLMSTALLAKCYACEAKDHLQDADLIIGEFLRCQSVFPEFEDGHGVSAVVILSEKGQRLWKDVKEKFYIKESDFKVLSNHNYHLEHSAKIK